MSILLTLIVVAVLVYAVVLILGMIPVDPRLAQLCYLVLFLGVAFYLFGLVTGHRGVSLPSFR